MSRVGSFIKSSFGIFLISIIPFLALFWFYRDLSQDFLDSRYSFIGSLVAFGLTYLIYKMEFSSRRIRDMVATWIAFFTLVMVSTLYYNQDISRNLFGSYLLYYLLVIFIDWKRIA
jgi:hypothetical protein